MPLSKRPFVLLGQERGAGGAPVPSPKALCRPSAVPLPPHVRAFQRGNTHRELDNLEQSIEDLRAAVELEDRNQMAHNNLGLSYFEQVPRANARRCVYMSCDLVLRCAGPRHVGDVAGDCTQTSAGESRVRAQGQAEGGGGASTHLLVTRSLYKPRHAALSVAVPPAGQCTSSSTQSRYSHWQAPRFHRPRDDWRKMPRRGGGGVVAL